MSAVAGAGMGQPQYEAAPTGGVNVRTLRIAGKNAVVEDINATAFDYPGINPSDLTVFIYDGSVYIWVGGVRAIGYGQPPIDEDDLAPLEFGISSRIADIPGLADALENGRKLTLSTSNSLDTLLRSDFNNRHKVLASELNAVVGEHIEDPNNPHGIARRIAQQIQQHLNDANPHSEYVKPEVLTGYARKGYAKIVHSGIWAPGTVWEDWHTVGGWSDPTVMGVGATANANCQGFMVNEFGLWQARISLVLEHAAAQMNRSIGLCLAHEGDDELDTAVFGTQMGTSMTNINADLLIKVLHRGPIQLRIMAGNEYRKVKVLAGTVTMVKL